MNKLHKKRIYLVLFFICGTALATGLILYALKQNINVFLTPAEVTSKQIQSQQTFRLGGFVKPGSLQTKAGTLMREFTLSDRQKDIRVHYQGSLPDLFREGKGAVLTGHFKANGEFMASQVLAKHDENYMPPKVAKALANKEHA